LRRIEKPEKPRKKRRFSGESGFSGFSGTTFPKFRIYTDLTQFYHVYPVAQSVSVKNTENAQTFPISEFWKSGKFSQIRAVFRRFPFSISEFQEIGPNFFEIYIVHTVKMAHNIAF
jgi:hypothetical protein